jgi:hypothetical protein
MQYQDRDWEIVDYQGFSLPNVPKKLFRGVKPETLKAGSYFVCVGAAQTFGCFCEKPYPTLLQERLNFTALNFGLAGAGPSRFLGDRVLFEYINNAKFAIVQVMSGRSESNSLFDSGDGREILTRRSDGREIGAELAYKELLAEKERNYLKKIIAETRENWLRNFQQLLQEIKIPKVLFWFSTREPFYVEDYTNVNALFGRYPQLVNEKMINSLKKSSNKYVECVSGRGMPQLLISRFTHKPITIDSGREDLRRLHGDRQMYNQYYPSPEMHVDAAKALEKVCQSYLK